MKRSKIPTTPFERMRYQFSDDPADGFISRYYYDGRNHWYIWNDAGLRAEVRSRHDGTRQLDEFNRTRRTR